MESSIDDYLSNIPLADEDQKVIIQDDVDTLTVANVSLDDTYDSMSSSCVSSQPLSIDSDLRIDEKEEKARLISQVLELQNTLDDLAQRVDSVKAENLKLMSENQVLGQYIENLMSASSVFQSTSPNKFTRNG